MMTALLAVIFFSFIGVGLPDSVLGTAWPAMYREFDLPISLAGYITATISACTIISSLISTRAIRRFGTGMVTAVSTVMTALALLGFAASGHAVFFFLMAVPLGLGAGTIDTALNNFVALHYTASQMNFLHCFYGIGVSASPYIMSLALGADDNWRKGYLIVALLQCAIALVSILALPLWKKAERRDQEENGEEPPLLSLRELIKMPAVRLTALVYFACCALELCAGSWSSSYFVNTRGLHADRAAATAMMFYLGLACARFLSGLLAGKLGRRRLIALAVLVQLAGLVLFALPLPLPLTAFALFLIGFGVGPIFPNLTHLTPEHFGKSLSQSVIGVQQAGSYVGIMIMPWLFGLLAQVFSTALLPWYLLALFVLFAVALAALQKAVVRMKAEKE